MSGKTSGIMRDFVGGVTDNWKDMVDDLLNRDDAMTTTTGTTGRGIGARAGR
ncbi:hypothetical protein SFUMM280S_02934 [Streptomyces fumanus]